jgi:hypothetical protein
MIKHLDKKAEKQIIIPFYSPLLMKSQVPDPYTRYVTGDLCRTESLHSTLLA